MKDLKDTLDNIISINTNKIIISGPTKSSEFKKIIAIKKKDHFESEQLTGNKVFHKSINTETIINYIISFSEYFKQINIWDDEYEYNLRIKQNKPVVVGKSKLKKESLLNDNKENNYILKEGTN